MTSRLLTLIGSLVVFTGYATAGPMTCPTALLTTYTNGGSPFLCVETGGDQIGFNQNPLPSYAGLNLLSLNNGAADPTAITVDPGTSSLSFESSTFVENASLLSTQAELVQFNVYDASPILSTTFSLQNPTVSGGTLGVGAGIAIGQELVCVGGNFTSLPLGLVTSVANGLLGTGEFGCNGSVLVGTAAADAGLLTAITGVANLPNLTGLTNQAEIQLMPFDATTLDVIKIQALFSVAGGSASTTGFGNSFTVAPEPDSAVILMLGLAGALCANKLLQMKARRH